MASSTSGYMKYEWPLMGKDGSIAKSKQPEPIKTDLEIQFEKKIKYNEIILNSKFKFYLTSISKKKAIRRRLPTSIFATATDEFEGIWGEINKSSSSANIKLIKHSIGVNILIDSDLKLKSFKYDNIKYSYNNSMITDYNSILTNFAKVKIINYEESSKLFKFTNYKKQMFAASNPTEEDLKLNKELKPVLYDITNVECSHECKADGVARNIITVYNREIDKSLKFVLDDVEIVYPNIDNFIKSYNKPKDRSIKIGDLVKLKNNRGVNRNVKLNENYIYKANKNTGYKKYATLVDQKNKLTFNVPTNKLKKIC
jgi:hypothetical protein